MQVVGLPGITVSHDSNSLIWNLEFVELCGFRCDDERCRRRAVYATGARVHRCRSCLVLLTVWPALLFLWSKDERMMPQEMGTNPQRQTSAGEWRSTD
jgi:hypothetical protein